MKIYNNISGLFRAAFLCVLIAGITACEDQTIVTQGGDLPPTEGLDSSFGLLRGSRSAGNQVVVRLYKKDVTHNFYFELTQPTTSVVTLKAVVDPAFVDTYNTEHKTELSLFPMAKATIASGGQISVAANEHRSVSMDIKFSYDGVDPGNYLLPVVVKDLSATVKPSTEYSVLYFLVVVPSEGYLPEGTVNPLHPFDKPYKVIGYVDTEIMQPLVANQFYLEYYNFTGVGDEMTYSAWFDIVNLLTTTVKYNAQDKRPILTPHSDLRYVLNNYDKYILPVQAEGRKVCITVKGGGQGIGFCNLSDTQINDLVFQIKTTLDQYHLDGVNLWDENSGYGKAGMSAVNTSSYPKFIKALREALGADKLITLVDVGDPTATFNVAQAGVEVGKYIDYAWHGYRSECVNPWADNSRDRKPIAGLNQNRYGGYFHQADKLYSEEEMYEKAFPSFTKLLSEGLNSVFAIDDIPCHKQGALEGYFVNLLTLLWLECGVYDPEKGMGYMQTFGTYADGGYGKWQKDW